MLFRIPLFLFFLVGILALFGFKTSRAEAANSLEKRLARAVTVTNLNPKQTAALVIDGQTGKVIFSRNPSTSLVPASNEKIPIAFAALSVLGPSYRTQTALLGRGIQKGAIWKGHLVLKGFGDPGLHTNDLQRLVKRLEARGIRHVTGRIIGDESFFDDKRTAPGWKASFYKLWSPPLSALIVNRAFFRGRTVDKPAAAAARAFQAELEAAGITVRLNAKAGRINEKRATSIASVQSPTIEQLVKFMNTESDNFTAEMLLKLLGAHVRGKGTTAAGAKVVRRVLRNAGVSLEGVRIVDGSGLSSSDRLTTQSVVDIIVAARNLPEIWPPFKKSLAIAGVSGTLKDRMKNKPALRSVRAKTGTTNLSSALSGIIKDRYIFSIIMNGTYVPWWRTRPAQDRFATILARMAQQESKSHY